MEGATTVPVTSTESAAYCVALNRPLIGNSKEGSAAKHCAPQAL